MSDGRFRAARCNCARRRKRYCSCGVTHGWGRGLLEFTVKVRAGAHSLRAVVTHFCQVWQAVSRSLVAAEVDWVLSDC